jgi:ribonuclease J
MRITIHRGINQIGGCITEVATDKTRILIDLGQNLPDGEGVVKDDFASHEAIEEITQGIDAIFYTHYHGDHLGLFHYVPNDVQQYIGKVAKRVALCKHRQLSFIKGREELSGKEMAKLEKMGELSPKQPITIGDIKITPYFVSHSAYDAYMFLIEAEGKRILHTGDFRGHGYISKGLLPTIEKLILSQGDVNFLITEGTMLSRLGERVMTENELQKEAEKIMSRYKNVFVMCSSTDMERLATFYAANKRLKRPLVCDRFQKSILEIFAESAGERTPLFCFDKAYDFNPANSKLMNWMTDKGFCMLVRATDKFKDYYQSLVTQLDPNETILIYSMWKEYINTNCKHAVQRYIDFVSMFPNIEKLHTSGHATTECLADVCNLVNPTLGIIPIHSEQSDNYRQLNINSTLKEKIITTSQYIEGVEIGISLLCG